LVVGKIEQEFLRVLSSAGGREEGLLSGQRSLSADRSTRAWSSVALKYCAAMTAASHKEEGWLSYKDIFVKVATKRRTSDQK